MPPCLRACCHDRRDADAPRRAQIAILRQNALIALQLRADVADELAGKGGLVRDDDDVAAFLLAEAPERVREGGTGAFGVPARRHPRDQALFRVGEHLHQLDVKAAGVVGEVVR